MPKNRSTRNGARRSKLRAQEESAARRAEMKRFETWRKSAGLSLEDAARLWAERNPEPQPAPDGAGEEGGGSPAGA